MVYSPLVAASKYFKYYIHASNSKGHGMHSPFVFEFITQVMNDFTRYPDYERTEALRKALLKDPGVITVEDMGAGSSKTRSRIRKVASIAKNAAKPAKYGQLMYRMVRHYGAKRILEMGSSLGLTTSYLAAADPGARVITMEGAPSVAALAREHFSGLGLKNIEMVEGNFDDTLPAVLESMPEIDFAFIDGNHRQEPTERYFSQLLPHIHNDTLLVFDDIHWSGEMEAAWKNIVAHEAVTCDIDLFYIGIVSFRKEFREKQGFSVRF
ncbi:O-methyltransferase [Niabella drilacis]|uniref:Methyltransferase domain-containing protein n=1 Tax=Niabella drilacis (strain DSM 25811 / CCM 8410 / CCUG 62505 / LMG 26954 / E90) TaxID=1285928 RepID=A0A1G6TZV6_NIADE|nr:class I SAM-dependent methyltransferase [Niabella drilacis]SDD34608.1 Methyltransferase domain-containing protein [Niabella drilacis]